MTDNIFSGLKVVDFASFMQASAAVILSDFGAEVIKVEPPAAIRGGSDTKFLRNPKRRKRTPFIWPIATSEASLWI